MNSKINRLPTELLSRILWLSDKYLRLSTVCRHWREIIYGSSIFWTVIRFSPWKGKEHIQEFISRSRSAQLTVSSLENDVHGQPPRYTEEIISTFSQLLETEGHRVKHLFLTGDMDQKLPKVLSGKRLPVMNTFVFNVHRYGNSLPDSDEILLTIKASDCLEYLSIPLSLSLSLSQLGPSFFSRLKGLYISLYNDAVAKHFFTFMSSCSNIKSLTIITPLYRTSDLGLPSTISLPNLLSLYIHHPAFLDQIHAPALRRLFVPCFKPQLDYLIFNEYDFSSIRLLSIFEDAEQTGEFSSIQVRGSAHSAAWRQESPGSMYTAYSNSYSNHDLWGSSIPVQFSIMDARINPDSEISFLSKVLPKFHNIKVLCCKTDMGDLPLTSLLKQLRVFFKGIFDNFASVKLRQLVIDYQDQVRYPAVLRVIFSIFSDYSILSKLNIITLRSERSDVSGDAVGKELVNFLRHWQKKGNQSLKTIEMEKYSSLPQKWVAEAATLGVHVLELSPNK